MYKNFKMTFDYRYVENENAVICFATPRFESNELFRYVRTAGAIKDKMPEEILSISDGLMEYKGIARFKEGDINNKETARKIARAKAVRRAFKAYKNAAQYCFDAITSEAFDLCGFITSIENKIGKVEEEINEYIT